MVNKMNLPGGSESLEERKDTSTEGSINESEVKEKEFLHSLLTKKLKIDNLKNQIQGLDDNKKDESFGMNIHGLIINKYDEIENEKKSIREIIKAYVASFSDEEKKHVFEMMGKSGLMEFSIDNLNLFGKEVNREIFAQMINLPMSPDYIKYLEKFEFKTGGFFKLQDAIKDLKNVDSPGVSFDIRPKDNLSRKDIENHMKKLEKKLGSNLSFKERNECIGDLESIPKTLREDRERYVQKLSKLVMNEGVTIDTSGISLPELFSIVGYLRFLAGEKYRKEGEKGHIFPLAPGVYLDMDAVREKYRKEGEKGHIFPLAPGVYLDMDAVRENEGEEGEEGKEGSDNLNEDWTRGVKLDLGDGYRFTDPKLISEFVKEYNMKRGVRLYFDHEKHGDKGTKGAVENLELEKGEKGKEGSDNLSEKERDLLSYLQSQNEKINTQGKNEKIRDPKLILDMAAIEPTEEEISLKLALGMSPKEIKESLKNRMDKEDCEKYNEQLDIKIDVMKRLATYCADLDENEKQHTFDLLEKYGYKYIVDCFKERLKHELHEGVELGPDVVKQILENREKYGFLGDGLRIHEGVELGPDVVKKILENREKYGSQDDLPKKKRRLAKLKRRLKKGLGLD